MIRTLSFSALALAASLGAAQAQTEIQWWHAMGGELGTKLEEIVAGYNASQPDYKVVPTYKGSYTETMTAAIAAFRAGEQPAVVARSTARRRRRHRDRGSAPCSRECSAAPCSREYSAAPAPESALWLRAQRLRALV